MSLTREQIFAAKELPKELIPVPEWGGDVWVWGLTGTQRDQFEADSLDFDRRGKARPNLDNLRARLAALCCRSEEGKPLFTIADVRELGEHAAAALERVFAVAQRLSGLSKEDVEELAKNSVNGRA